MLAGDPRADPAVVDLIELAGLWLAADDRGSLVRSLRQLVSLLDGRFGEHPDYRARFANLLEQASDEQTPSEDLRRIYRRATLG